MRNSGDKLDLHCALGLEVGDEAFEVNRKSGAVGISHGGDLSGQAVAGSVELRTLLTLGGLWAGGFLSVLAVGADAFFGEESSSFDWSQDGVGVRGHYDFTVTRCGDVGA